MDSEGPVRLVPRNKYLLVAAILVLCVALAQVTRLIQLPLAQFFSGPSTSVLSTSNLVAFMQNNGYLSLFILMAMESAAIPIPSEVVLPFAGYLVSIGAMDFAFALVVSTVASLVGGLIDYYLAFFLGRPFVVSMLRVFRVDPRALDRAEGWFERSGQWTVFVARFVPVVRSVISLPAGLFEMKLVPFITMTVVGCLGWSAILVYAGYAAGKFSATIFSSSAAVVDGLSLIIAVAAGAYVVYYFVAGRGRNDGRGALEAESASQASSES